MTTALKRPPAPLTMINTQPVIDTPIPSVSITNKPANSTSLYHTCRSVLDRLSLVEGMSTYLENETPSSASTSSESTNGNTTSDPLSKLWSICRRGAPLATLLNALNPEEPLKYQTSSQINECKKIVYHFIVACRKQLDFTEEDVFTLSDLYKDNTNGFVKVVNTINKILNLLEENGTISVHSTDRDSLENTPKDTRDKVVVELLETERKYVQDLELLQNYMRELQIQEILTPDTVHYLFGNLNSLVDFQRRFLIHLEEIAEKSAQEQNFGSLFSQLEDQFTVYEPYCSNYFSAQDLVTQEAPKLQKLADILNPVYELPSMLIKPVQRICKYPLLMQQLIKSTNSDWPHVAEMEEGLEAIKRVTEKVNETQRKHENMQVVESLKSRLDELRGSNIDSFGSLLLQDKLILTSVDDTEKELQVFFFEKTLLICKENKDKGKSAKNTISIKKKRRASLQPRGLIFTNRILAVHNRTENGVWSLAIEWRDREVDRIHIRFRNEEQIKLWESTLRRVMTPIKTTVSNTQLASMKSPTMPTSVPEFLRVDEDDESDQTDDEDAYQRSRSNSMSAHLLNTISGRPKIPRNMSADPAPGFNNGSKTPRSYQTMPLPRSSSSTNTLSQDYYYPASPPPSNPSSPTSSSRASQSSARQRDGSPLADIGSKFMASDTEDYRQFPLPPHMSRSQSTSYNNTFQSNRLRSQSSPNIHKWEERNMQQPPSPLEQHSNVKIKLNYNDGIYVILCPLEVTFIELMDKVDKKIRLVSHLKSDDILRLKYQDEDGDLITINSDEDVQMAFESRSNAVNLFITV